MPSGASDKSHELLQDLGIKEVQVQQLRFFCRELYDQSVKTYMHFKLNNKNVIKTAFTGNQKGAIELSSLIYLENAHQPLSIARANLPRAQIIADKDD